MNTVGSISKPTIFLAIGVAVLIALINIVNPFVSIGIAVVFALALFLVRKPIYSIAILILATPFSATALLDKQLAGVPGMKIANLLAIVAVGLFLLKMKRVRILRGDKIFIVGLLVIFTVAVIRSTGYIGLTYNMIWSDQYSLSRYLLSNLIKPILIFLPLILIVNYIRNKEDLRKIALSIMFSIILLSATILVLYVFFIPNKMDFEKVRIGFSAILGMHDNNLADFYIAVYPMLLAYAVSKKSWFFAGGVFISLCAIGVIYSRSAYLVIILCTFAFFLFSHRAKLLPWIIGGGLISLTLIPQSIIQRALTGLAGNDVNAISAGRVDQIWIPLIHEFLEHPLKLIIGTGRYAIMSTVAFKSGTILKVGHAHSMYLDTLFDAGIIGLGFFLIFFFMFIKRFFKAHKLIKDKVFLDILIGIEISIVAFLIRGITDSFFFPTLTNSFLWLDLGLGIAIVYFFTEYNIEPANAIEETIFIQEDLKYPPAEESERLTEARFLFTGSVMNYETVKERDEDK